MTDRPKIVARSRWWRNSFDSRSMRAELGKVREKAYSERKEHEVHVDNVGEYDREEEEQKKQSV